MTPRRPRHRTANTIHKQQIQKQNPDTQTSNNQASANYRGVECEAPRLPPHTDTPERLIERMARSRRLQAPKARQLRLMHRKPYEAVPPGGSDIDAMPQMQRIAACSQMEAVARTHSRTHARMHGTPCVPSGFRIRFPPCCHVRSAYVTRQHSIWVPLQRFDWLQRVTCLFLAEHGLCSGHVWLPFRNE